MRMRDEIQENGRWMRRTSRSFLSKMRAVKLLCVRKACLAMAFPSPWSCSAMYPIVSPRPFIMTYLFACSKPRKTFIISICLCMTRELLFRRSHAGWLGTRTPSGSSGILTGAIKSDDSFSARAVETRVTFEGS